MRTEWNDDQPIYRQLRERIVALILDNAIAEGEAIPSARTIAAEFRINPLTVLKAFQMLSDEGLVDNRRGVGMFVKPGVRERLLKAERRRFLEEEWPRVRATIAMLGLSAEDLLHVPRPAPQRAKSGSR
jgi:GntR family transcriptional regulator